MKTQQYVLPPESVIDIAFQHAKVNYNLHINTNSGVIYLNPTEENSHPYFIYLLDK